MTNKNIPSIKELRLLVQASKVHGTPWHYVINRKISIYITWTLLHTTITANTITLFSIILGLCGAVLVLFASSWGGIVGYILLYLYLIFDKVDGEIARFYEQKSLAGVCLDYIGHLIIPPLVLLSAGGYLAKISHIQLLWGAGALSALSCMFLRAGRDMLLCIIYRKHAEFKCEFADLKKMNDGILPSSHLTDKKIQQKSHQLSIFSHTFWIPRGSLRKTHNLLIFSHTFWIPLLILALTHSLFLLNNNLLQMYIIIFLILCFFQFLKALLLCLDFTSNYEQRIQSILIELSNIFSE